MAPFDLSLIRPVLTRSLAWAGLVFLAQAFGAWGLGDAIVAAFRVQRDGESRLARPLLSLAVGFGVLGQSLFVLGLIGNAYQKRIIGAVLLALAVFAVTRLRPLTVIRSLRLPKALGFAGWAVVALVAVYFVRWGWVSLGFNAGSDVFTHHYPFVKFSIRAQHFAHPMHLPLGLDMISSYNPALARMLWLPGHLLADERAANMFHWLTQVMLIGALYIFGRGVRSPRAGALAVAMYLTVGLLAYNPLEAQDYTFMAMYLVLALYMTVIGLRDGNPRAFILSGILAGLMLSTKSYAVPIAGVMTAAILFWEPITWKVRIRSAVIFGAVAFAVFAPWLLYNVVKFHDPFFPAMLQNEEMRFYRATERVDVLGPVVLPSDRGFFQPTLFYYLSLFVPYVGPYRTAGLSAMFLIGLPCSLYYLLRARSAEWRPANALFVVSVVTFTALIVVFGQSAHYKWALFPAVIYAVSLGLLVDRLPRSLAGGLWTTTLVAAGLNYWYVAAPFIESYAPPAREQQVRWGEVDRYLNANAEPNAVVSGTDAGFYLRPDLTGIIESTRVSTDWPSEEALIRRAGITYMIVYPTELATDDRLTKLWSREWRQLSPSDTSQAEYIEDVNRRHQERSRAKAAFLGRYGTPVHEFSSGAQLYRIRPATQ
jgi:hypothetical protein